MEGCRVFVIDFVNAPMSDFEKMSLLVVQSSEKVKCIRSTHNVSMCLKAISLGATVSLVWNGICVFIECLHSIPDFLFTFQTFQLLLWTHFAPGVFKDVGVCDVVVQMCYVLTFPLKCLPVHVNSVFKTVRHIV